MKHPDIDFARKTLNQVLMKKRFSGWSLGEIGYQFMPNQYLVKFSNDEKELTIPIYTDYFDDHERNPSMMTLKKIKDKIKQVLVPNDSSDDE